MSRIRRTTAGRLACGVGLLLVASLAGAQSESIPAGPELAPYPSTGLPYEGDLAPLVEDLPTVTEKLNTAAAEPPIDPMLDPTLEPVTVYQWYEPIYWFGPEPWDNAIEIGINGASGTSDTFSMRSGGYIKRETERRKISTSLYYNYTKAEGLVTQSNALFDARHDWLFGDSPWTIYLMSQTFYDEFQAFDLNVNVNSGLGYQWIKQPDIELMTRFGAGAARKFGLEDNWTPEAQFGFDFTQKIGDRQKFYAKVDYFPQWENFNKYRVMTDVGFEFQLSVPSNLSLKLSATDRYDSNPAGVPPHNTNYSVLMLWKL